MDELIERSRARFAKRRNKIEEDKRSYTVSEATNDSNLHYLNTPENAEVDIDSNNEIKYNILRKLTFVNSHLESVNSFKDLRNYGTILLAMGAAAGGYVIGQDSGDSNLGGVYFATALSSLGGIFTGLYATLCIRKKGFMIQNLRESISADSKKLEQLIENNEPDVI
jgi:hypothetical protein